MPTSGTTVWSMTARDFVKRAMGPLLSPGTEPDADELADCLIHLNGMLKSWAMRGATLFREASVDITTTAATAAKTLPVDVRSISSARLILSATSERPLYEWDRSQYLSLPNKTTVGQPSIYYLDRARDAAVITFWPVSATPVTVRLDYDKLPETVTDGSETLDIRQELHETVWTNLALIIRPEVFGTEVPATTMARAVMLEQQMFDAERPDAYYFEADCA